MSRAYLGDFDTGKVIRHFFNTADITDLPVTMTAVTGRVYKDNSTTESSAGITVTTDFDGRTGFHLIEVDETADAAFYAAASDFTFFLTATVNGIVIIDLPFSWSIKNRYVADSAGVTTLLSRLTAGRATNLDNLDAAITSRSTYAGADTAGTGTLLTRLSAARALNLDFLDVAVSSRSTYAGADPAGVTTLLARLTAGRATNLDFIDIAISSRSTYAGADTAGTGTLLARLTAGRALNLDNLDALISSRSTYAGVDTSGVTTLLARLTAGRALNLDNLDALISSRSIYAGTDTAGVTTLLARLTAGRALNLDFLDAAISSLPTATVIANALLDLADAIETGLTLRGSLRLIVAAEAGKTSGAGTATFLIRNAKADTKVRLTVTVDGAGNRTVIVSDLT